MNLILCSQNLILCSQELDTVESVKDDTVTCTEVKSNVTPILQPFTSTEEKSAQKYQHPLKKKVHHSLM